MFGAVFYVEGGQHVKITGVDLGAEVTAELVNGQQGSAMPGMTIPTGTNAKTWVYVKVTIPQDAEPGDITLDDPGMQLELVDRPRSVAPEGAGLPTRGGRAAVAVAVGEG